MRIRCYRQVAAVAAALMVLASGARAESISYVLDQSNADPLLPDGRPYVQVTVADGAAGAINFTVSILPALTGIADVNFGLKGFAFSSQGAAQVLRRSNIVGLPAGWSISFGNAAGDFGTFDVLLSRGTSGVPVGAQLSFSIAGVSSDSIADYVVLSGGRAAQGRVYYAARVGGLLDQDPGKKQLTHAWFGGSQSMAPTVPLPGTAWLLASAFGCLGSVRRRWLAR